MNHDLRSVIPLHTGAEKWGDTLDAAPLHTVLEDVIQERNTIEIR